MLSEWFGLGDRFGGSYGVHVLADFWAVVTLVTPKFSLIRVYFGILVISDDRASEEIHADWLDEVLSFPSFRVTDDRASEVHAVWPDDISAHFWLVSKCGRQSLC